MIKQCKLLLLGIVIPFLLVTSCRKPTAPPDHDTGILWTKTYGGAYDDWGYSVEQTSDEGYIIVGYTNSFNAGDYEVYLIKTDKNGDTLWTKTYRGVEGSFGYSVQQSSDGGYIIAGQNIIIISAASDVYIIKTDENGDTMWTRNYGQALYYEAGLSIQETFDGGYIIAGSTYLVSPPDPGDVYLIKTDINGDTLWTRVYECGDYGTCVQQANDGGYIITGVSSMSYQTNKMDVLLIKTDENGDTLWAKTYGGEKSEAGKSVQQTSDGGYIVLGTISFDRCSYLIKTNANGDTLWTRIYDEGMGYSVLQTSDGGYIIAGYTTSYGTGDADIFILKTDSDGNILWTSTCGGENYDAGRSIIETSDGAYIIVGTTGSFGSGGHDVYLVKFRQ
ncbi:hypothetical protein ES703_10764 [subsurface metagenome]